MPLYDTAQEIVTAALGELGLTPVSLSSYGTDTNGLQILTMLNALGDELSKVHDWQSMERVMEFTGDGSVSTFQLPVDFGRQVNQTQWDTSNRRPMRGPDSPQLWSWSQYGIVSVGVFYRYRILNNEYAVFPTPGAGESFALYYISKNWVRDADDPTVLKDKVTGPNDVVLFDRRLVIAGLKVKFWAQKGFDTTVLQEEFQYMLDAEKGQNQGARAISLSRGQEHFLLNWQNVPDGSTYGV